MLHCIFSLLFNAQNKTFIFLTTFLCYGTYFLQFEPIPITQSKIITKNWIFFSSKDCVHHTMHMHMRTLAFMQKCTHMHAHLQTHMHVHLHMHTHAHADARAHTCTHTHNHTYMHACTHACTHACMHTNTPTCV